MSERRTHARRNQSLYDLSRATWSDSWKGADLPIDRIMQASDIAEAIAAQLKMSPSAVIEEILLRPQLGDL